MTSAYSFKIMEVFQDVHVLREWVVCIHARLGVFQISPVIPGSNHTLCKKKKKKQHCEVWQEIIDQGVALCRAHWNLVNV